MTTHTITLARHTAQVVGLMGLVGVLVLGTWDSYGTEQLLLRHGPEWEGLAIDATFHNVPNDEGVTVLADTDGLVPVPPEACIRPSRCATITFWGVQDGIQRISCNLPYMVLDHAQVPGANSTATPSENAQALAQMQDLRDGAVDAKRHAEAARDGAANSAADAKKSETNAGQSATAAKTAQSAAETAKAGAETAQKAAASSASSASTSASTATTQAAAAKSSATTAKASEAAAGKSAKEAAASAANLDSAVNTATQKAAAASASAEAAKASESAAASSEAAARKYANSAELAAKTAGEAAAEKLQQMQAIQDDVTAKQAQTATDATVAEKAKVAAEAAQNGAAASKAAAANSSAAAKASEDAAAKSAADANSTANSINNSMMQIAALQKRQNVLVGSETGNPASCDDAFAAPLCGLNVYGKSTQNGTPSPDNPVPIVSAGDGGSVVVKMTGKNRMPPNLNKRAFVECFVKESTPITLIFKDGFVSRGGNILFIGENNENLWFGIDVNKAEHHMTIKANATKFQYLLNDTASENVCLTWNASSPDYEPYREQLLTLPTPNGLPGIPVTSGGNYTDPQGQQWVCDEVDLERGVKVQRVDKTAFDSTKTLAEQNAILATPIETPLTPAEIVAYKALTAYAPDTVVQAGDGAGVKLEYQRDVNIAIKKLEDAIASITAT
ncbi:hypothetical protein [Gemmiger sp.]|uniref:hypothetical protein n=1 Tax=Gemmiger sp. TaxID=2049027 RepID=UPI0025BA94D2|nr:hypothetical protein [Gemmiger sp.]